VSKALKAIDNCRNLGRYDMTDEAGRRIIDVLLKGVRSVESAYSAKGRIEAESFKL